MKLKLFAKGGFDFAKGVMSKSYHARPGQRHLHLRAMAQESRERNRVIQQGRLLEQPA